MLDDKNVIRKKQIPYYVTWLVTANYSYELQ